MNSKRNHKTTITMKFPKLVIEEAKSIVRLATKKEKSKLCFDDLDPEDHKHCIYGQMTGDCYSKRAAELIRKSCKKVYKYSPYAGYSVADGAKLNGKPVFNALGYRDMADGVWWLSPIEIFISRARRSGNTGSLKKLVGFLKGEIKTL